MNDNSSDAALSACDCLTIRDLVALSGYRDAELPALLRALFIAVNEGSICLKFNKAAIGKKLETFLDPGKARSMAERITSKEILSAYPALVTSDELDYKPLVLKSIGGERYLYFHKYPRYEVELKEALVRLIKYKDTGKAAPGKLQGVIKEVLEKKRCRRGGRSVDLDGEQERAVRLALLRNFVIISGGPGTGKTSIVITILRCLMRLGFDHSRIRIAAPTGRSAKRMADSIRQNLASLGSRPAKPDRDLAAVKESTVHRLLGYNPYRNEFLYNQTNPIPADVVIVDEVSMIDIVLMARLFEALAPGTKVILLGDKDQLPSVEAGAVLADLIPGDELSGGDGRGLLTGRLVILKRSYRSEAKLLETARRVNEGDVRVSEDMAAFPFAAKSANWPSPGKDSGAAFLETAPGDVQMWRNVLDAWISRFFLAKHASRPGICLGYAELIKKSRSLDLSGRDIKDAAAILDPIFAYLEQGKILTFLKRGLYGTYWTNRYIARRLQPLLDKAARAAVFAGEPIMITENDPVHELYNGDVGVILRSADGDHRAIFQRPGVFASIPLSELPGFETAFAITIHKSQGSEYDSVFLVLPQDEKNRLLSKEIIYTGLTRARHSAVIYGSRSVLGAAIARKIERQSGIKLWE